MLSIRVTAETPVNPSEDEAKVQRALLNIFPDARVERRIMSDGLIMLRVTGLGLDFLSTFRSLIRQENIRSAARRIMIGQIDGEQIRIH